MDNLPAPVNQPFVCEVCNVAFGSGKALATHLQEPHKPWRLSEWDRMMLKSFRIKEDE